MPGVRARRSTCRARAAARRRRRAPARARCRCCAAAAACGWPWRHERRAARLATLAAGRARPAQRAARPRGASRDGRCELCPIGIGEDHRHLLHLDERRIVCVCETCWSMRSGDAGVPPARRAHAVARGLRACPTTLWAAFQIPIGLAFLMRSSVTRRGRRALPEPGRRDGVRARADGVGRAVRGQPGPRPPRARRRGADRRPARRPAPLRDRPDRPVLPARRPDQGALGGHHRRARRRRGGRRVLRRHARAGARRMSVDAAARGAAARRAGRSRSSTSSRSRTRRRRRCASTCTSTTRSGARSTRSRCRRRSRSTRRGAPTTTRRASGSSSCSGRPSAGRRRRRSSAGRTSTCSCRGFTGATSFALDVPCTYDLEVAASKYFYSLPDGEVPLSFLFSGMVLYRGEGDRLQVAQVPWSCTARWRMPVDGVASA